MTTVLDTPQQDATRSALCGYAAVVPTDNETNAKAHIAKIEAIREAERQEIIERDKAIAAMHLQDGLTPPEISRRLGLSIALCRNAVDKAKLIQQARQQH